MVKKVMLITPMLHQGGFERACVMTARLLKEKGYEVVIAVFSMEDIAFDVSGLTVLDLRLKAKSGKIGKIINIFRRCIRLSSLQKKMGIQISYSFGMTANISNALSFGAEKKITACHSFEEIKNKLYMNLISHRSDKVLCCSKKMADLVCQNYSFNNVLPLWNPCDIENVLKQSKAQPDKDIDFFRTGDKVLVSMGREDDVKGFWHLIRIFKKVNEEIEGTRLAIIGDGSYAEYKRMVKEAGLTDKVLFSGLKTNPFPYLRESDIYILTSLSEGLPNALVESLTLSLPVVSANCLSGPAEILHGNFREAESKTEVFCGDYGILAPRLSPRKNLSVQTGEDGKIKLEKEEKDFAGAIIDLLLDKELYERYREGALPRAKDFSSGQYMEELLNCMEQL